MQGFSGPRVALLVGLSALQLLQPSVLFGSDALTPAPPTYGWLAYGDLRGHLEPCGCDPKTDLGGLRRIATLLRRERGANPGVLVFDLGGNAASPKSKESMKNRFMEEGLGALSPDARLFGAAEWAVLKAGGKPAAHLNLASFTLSNSVTAPGIGAGKGGVLQGVVPWRKAPSAVVYGYLSPTLAKGAPLESLTKPYLVRLAQLIQDNAVPEGRNILLFAGSDAELGVLMGAKLFTEIISANVAPLDREPGKEEKDAPALLARKPKFQSNKTDSENTGTPVWMVPLGGQGVLRGGALRLQKAKSVEELLRNGPVAGVPSTFEQEIVTWLDPSYEAEGVVDGVFVRYNAFAKEEMQKQSSSRAGDLAKSMFAGSEACLNCHKEEYAAWQSSTHAKAFATLKAKNKDQDPECVSCHVLGFDAKGGFVSESLSPTFAGVQCESCHGAAKAHGMNPANIRPKAPKGKAQDMCTNCHVTPHSSSFSFKEYWPKIIHGKQPR